MKKILFFTFIASFSFSSLAQGLNSLNWQKLALEEKIQRKYNSTLQPVLKDNQYMIEVEAEISEPPAPNFGDNGHKSGPRVSDINLADSRGDYIAFSKMGLEVPVVEKFLDEDRTKLMNLYRFNETYDLFKNITGIKVTVFLSDKLPEDLLQISKTLVQSSKLNLSGIKPSVKFESIPMEWIDPATLERPEEKKKPEEIKPVQEEPKIWAKDWLEWASRWGNAVGLILGALIIGFIALSLFKQWKAFMEAYAAKLAQKNEEEDKKEDEEAKLETQVANAEVPTEEDAVAISQGFDRFQQCLEQHPEEAVNMIRSWLNEGEEKDLLALRGIALQASSEQMEKLMDGLSDTQRDKWKGLLGTHMSPAEIAEANKHIFYEVIKAFLVPSRIKDGELLNLIMELNPTSTREFFHAHKNQVGILLNILSPTVIGKILGMVEDSLATQWLLAGSEFQMKTLESRLPELKQALLAFKESHAPSPFAMRIMSMIPTAAPSREITLYKALAKSGTMDMVMETAKKCFPSELVLDLPAPFLKEVIQSYPMFKRVELFLSRPDDVRETLLDIFAEAGTPARDMVNMEIENISRDPSGLAALQSRSEDIWFEFVKVGRTTLLKNASYKSYADQLLTEWSRKITSGLQSIKGGKAA